MITMEGITIARAQTTDIIKKCKKQFVFFMTDEISVSVTIFFIKEDKKNHIYKMDIDGKDVFESNLGDVDYDFDSFLWDVLYDSSNQQEPEERVNECLKISKEIHNTVIGYMTSNKIVYKI